MREDQSFVAGSHPDLNGRSAFEQVHGWTPDISLYIMHGWYEVVAFLDSDNERKLACWLGPAEDYGGGTPCSSFKICQTYREKYSLVPDPGREGRHARGYRGVAEVD
ncbi:hypothetical protein MHU86_2759 [Fragilaria crotonensis]|nr:hypothetical protein MHU86_2759 [Fragilaria crotonensis]